MDDDDYAEMQAFMVRRPDAGSVIRVPEAFGNCAGPAAAGVSVGGCE